MPAFSLVGAPRVARFAAWNWRETLYACAFCGRGLRPVLARTCSAQAVLDPPMSSDPHSQSALA